MKAYRRRWPAAALVVVAFLGARVLLVDRHGLWADEFFSLAMATGHSLEHPAALADPGSGDYVEESEAVPATRYARYLAHDSPPAGPLRVVRAVRLSDTSPPLYYLLLWAWTRVTGTSDVALRLFSLACALAVLPLLAALARRVGGAGAVLPACLLFAVSPSAAYYSTEGRMYSLVWLCATGCAWLTLDLARRGAGRGRVIAWILVASAGMLIHYSFAFVLAAAVLALTFRPGALARRQLLLATTAVALLILPWYIHLPEVTKAWRVTDYWLKVRPAGFERASGILALAWSYLSIHGVWGVAASSDAVHGALVALAALFATFRLGARWFAPRRWLVWLWIAAALAGPVLLDALQGTYLVAVPRYALAGLPAALLLAGAGLAALRRRWRFTLLALFVLTNLIGVRRMHLNEARIEEPFRHLGAKLATLQGPDDLIVIHSIPSGVAGLARAMVLAGSGSGDAPVLSWVEQLGQRRAPEDLLAAAHGCRRIVHVSLHAVLAPSAAESWLETHARRVRVVKDRAARLAIYEPAGGDRF